MLRQQKIQRGGRGGTNFVSESSVFPLVVLEVFDSTLISRLVSLGARRLMSLEEAEETPSPPPSAVWELGVAMASVETLPFPNKGRRRRRDFNR